MLKINFADDWIQTDYLWYQKRPLYQLSYNHCPTPKNMLICIFFVCKMGNSRPLLFFSLFFLLFF